jgi:uncharacterized protein (UPF0264 family)
MKLLVSVMDADEAAAALEGGADIIDAKDPQRGALGAVTPATLSAISERVDGARPITAALGDASDEVSLEATARMFASAGAALVKVGFAGITNSQRVAELLGAARRGVRAVSDRCGVVAVAYADADDLTPAALVDIAASSGAQGVLLDTMNKNAPGIRRIVPAVALSAWVRRAHQAALLAAVAGRLTTEDLSYVADSGADVAGVRGAACDDGRNGRVMSANVRFLRQAIGDIVTAR